MSGELDEGIAVPRVEMFHGLSCPPEHTPRDVLPFGERAKQMEQRRSPQASTLTPVLLRRGDKSEFSPTGTEMQAQKDCSAYYVAPLGATFADDKLLAHLQASVALPLEAAAGLLHTVDKDLSGELYHVQSLIHCLLVDTASALTSVTCAAEDVAVRVLPVLYATLASSRTKRTTTATSIGIAQGLVAEPQVGVTEVLHSYVLLVERVFYVHRCVSVTLDSECAEEDAGADANAVEGLHVELAGLEQDGVQPSEHGAGEALGAALVHLDRAIGALEECSDFWRTLRRTKHLLASMAESANSIRGQLLSGPKSFELQPGFESFVASLDQLCQDYCPMNCPKYSVEAPGRQQIHHNQIADADGAPSVFGGSCASVAASSSAPNRPRSCHPRDA